MHGYQVVVDGETIFEIEELLEKRLAEGEAGARTLLRLLGRFRRRSMQPEVQARIAEVIGAEKDR